MGVFIDYTFYAECSEEDLLERLRRLRRRVLDLPVERVGKILAVDPLFDPHVLRELVRQGYRLPAAVEERVGRLLEDRSHTSLCIEMMDPTSWTLELPTRMLARFIGPAQELVYSDRRCRKLRTELWNPRDYPKEFRIGFSLSMNRNYILFIFALALLRHGYLFVIDPCNGCESVVVSLSTLRCADRTPIWAGGGFTKTQYAVHFTRAHESVCAVLDAAQDEGLLFRAQDTCRYYEHRDWKRSAPIVNRETMAATMVSRLLDAGIDAARAAGMKIEVLSSPASECTNIVRAEGGKPKRKEKGRRRKRP